ncbi:MAG: DUF4430 domain-containing protein [Leptospiraceae bacterium]|nr:DUF4430 domain-containing protein [Leptospiraceae bacterium]
MKIKSSILALAFLALACGPAAEKTTENSNTKTVRLEVEMPSSDRDPYAENIEFSGGTVLALMQEAQKSGLKFTYSGEGEKAFINSIQGIKPSGEDEKSNYWIYAVNGKLANQGVGATEVNPGDSVRWCYLSYEQRKSCANGAGQDETSRSGEPETESK